MKLLLENFRKYLNEGKTIPANPSMYKWAADAFKAYRAAAKKDELKFDQPFFSAPVDGYDGEKIEVEMIITKLPETGVLAKSKRTFYAIRAATIGAQKQTMMKFQKEEGGDQPDFRMWKSIVLHELTHVIDPKFKLDTEKHPWRRTYQYGTEEYATSPQEIDAHIRGRIEDMKQWPFGDPITRDRVRNYKPEGWVEKIWKEKYPEIWKKLLNSLHAEIDDTENS